MPWVKFSNRMNRAERLYGERGPTEHEEVAAAHLRRGEYIVCISGCRSWSCSSGAQPLLARSLRMVTSEQQEIVVGESATSIDFCFKAEAEHEIIGLSIQDGVIIDVKQAALGPSRVSISRPCTPGNSSGTLGVAGVVTAAYRAEGPPRPDVPDWPTLLETRHVNSMEVLRRGRGRRIKEAYDVA